MVGCSFGNVPNEQSRGTPQLRRAPGKAHAPLTPPVPCSPGRQVAVYSYPFFPDCLAVAYAVARQSNHLRASGGLSGSASGSFDSRKHSR